MKTKTKKFKNMQLASKDFGPPFGRLYFRVVNISELNEDLIGVSLVFILDFPGPFPEGILLDVDDVGFSIKSPETGQILCIAKSICLGFTSARQMLTDLSDPDLQKNPQNYVVNFKP